jgi:hypothetical protein
LCAASAIGGKTEKLTPAGRAALRGWQDRCSGPAAVAGATTGAGWPDQLVAYAAALGRARAAVKLFSGTRDKTIWSGYGGTWRHITIGDPRPRSWVQAGGTGLWALALLLLALLPVSVATALLASGELRAAAFGVMAALPCCRRGFSPRTRALPTLPSSTGRSSRRGPKWTQKRTPPPPTLVWPSTTARATVPGLSPSPPSSTALSPRARWCTPGPVRARTGCWISARSLRTRDRDRSG